MLSVYVYDDADCEKVLKSVKEATPFGLTGAVFSQDKLVFFSFFFVVVCSVYQAWRHLLILIMVVVD